MKNQNGPKNTIGKDFSRMVKTQERRVKRCAYQRTRYNMIKKGTWVFKKDRKPEFNLVMTMWARRVLEDGTLVKIRLV